MEKKNKIIIAAGLLTTAVLFISAVTIRTTQFLKQTAESLGADSFHVTSIGREGIGAQFKNINRVFGNSTITADSLYTVLPGVRSCKAQNVSVSSQEAIARVEEIILEPCVVKNDNSNLKIDFKKLVAGTTSREEDIVYSEKGTLNIESIKHWIDAVKSCRSGSGEECTKALFNAPKLSAKLDLAEVKLKPIENGEDINFSRVTATFLSECRRETIKDVLNADMSIAASRKTSTIEVGLGVKDIPPEMIDGVFSILSKNTKDERIDAAVETAGKVRTVAYNTGITPGLEFHSSIRSNDESGSKILLDGAIEFTQGASSIKYNLSLNVNKIDDVSRISSRRLETILRILCNEDPCKVSRSGEVKLYE
ncbi:MAG: hypothetical protein QXO76_00500 [Thermoproteota archaeon]